MEQALGEMEDGQVFVFHSRAMKILPYASVRQVIHCRNIGDSTFMG